jgi:hypothetical protein
MEADESPVFKKGRTRTVIVEMRTSAVNPLRRVYVLEPILMPRIDSRRF